MKKTYLLLFSLLFAFYSCGNPGSTYHKIYDDFPDNRWAQADKKEFAFAITEDAAYDVILKFSHVYDYQFESVPMQVLIIGADANEQQLPVDLKIKDAAGKDLGDCLGDICDLDYALKSNTPLPKGNYKVIVSHDFTGPYLPNILGIGLEVKRSK